MIQARRQEPQAPGRAAGFSPDPAAHSNSKKGGRPKGIPMPEWWKAALAERSKRNWANPEWRAFTLARMAIGRINATREARPAPSMEEVAARRARKNLYQKMRNAGLSREQILRELGE